MKLNRTITRCAIAAALALGVGNLLAQNDGGGPGGPGGGGPGGFGGPGGMGGTLAEGGRYLLQLSRYVHFNQVRIRATRRLGWKEQLKLLRVYRWSSPLYFSKMH